MPKKVYQVDNTPNYSKVDKVYVMNPTGGGEVPAAHTHDDRYYTKTEIDQPQFFQTRIDNVTLALEGRELTVRSMDGLLIGVADINAWLAGTSGNIQTQINGINDSLTALTAGMKYIGKFETRADLNAVVAKDNGDLAVVLADESRTGGRSMYVFSSAFGTWEFIGEFTFTDAFTALKDTPTSYVGADGKVVKVAGNGLVFSGISYAELTDKPTSTITQIDDAVMKAHGHANADSLAKLGVNAAGELTINGIVYTPKQPDRKFLQAYKTTDETITGTHTIVFDNHRGGTIAYDKTTGHFTLEAGKTYVITCNVEMDNISEGAIGIPFYLIDTATDAVPTDTYAAGICSAGSGLGTFTVVYTPQNTRELKVRTALTETNSYRIRYRYTALTVHEI
ncbi:hypothetical protein [Sporosarcina sp. ITBMC105]